KQRAVDEVRMMAIQFADLYFAFASELREEYGEEAALKLTQRILYKRAVERAEKMIERARELGLARTPENITKTSDVPYLGWDKSLGADHCPYGMAWNRHIARHEWFRRFAQMYCDVTDTTIAEVFTGDCSHALYKNVVLGDEDCLRRYYPDAQVAAGKHTYRPEEL
ncbi:MAG: hypothetical protein Q4A66_08265, partial [Eubacteriales bacterium]|nr:hypothetical protein [Eubacteriales bacterium]